VVSSAAYAGALLAWALVAPGCLDAHLRDPGPLVIDDFEDGDLFPELPKFESWGCYSYNEQGGDISCDLAPGAPGSAYGLYLDFRIDDPPDGKQQHGGASLAIYDRETLDISPYQNLVFSAQLTSGILPLPAEAHLYVELGCSTVAASDGSHPGDVYVVSSAPFKSYWQAGRLDLAGFGFPSWLINKVTGGPERCLQVTDSIRFTVDAFLADGQSGEGVLTIDDIYLE
jgi:hypothetical protein